MFVLLSVLHSVAVAFSPADVASHAAYVCPEREKSTAKAAIVKVCNFIVLVSQLSSKNECLTHDSNLKSPETRTLDLKYGGHTINSVVSSSKR